MEYLIPLMPMLPAIPVAVAAVLIARIWSRRRDSPLAELEAQNHELRTEIETMRAELRDAQERLDFTERVLARHPRLEQVPPHAGPGRHEER